MRCKLFVFIFIFLPAGLFAQNNIADSLYQLLYKEKIDTNKVNLMCDIGYELRDNDPEKALTITNDALSLAKKIKYINGQARGLGTMAIIFSKVGNYPRALEFNLQRLKLVEKINDQEKFAGVLINIAIVYVYQEEYKKALSYYYKADSVIEQYNITDYKYNIALNMGDVYDKLNNNDSAYSYFNKSLILARQMKNDYYAGVSMIGLGHSYLKTDNYLLSMANYKSGLIYVKEADNEDLFCEATLGLAKLFKKLNQNDSALVYAKQSLYIAEKDGFIPRHLDAAKFLSSYYKETKNIDSSFYYLNTVQNLNDTINSKSRIRESQILSSNEQLRQLEIAENIQMAKRERKQQLQLLFIAIFIPGFFLLTLLLSRIKLHIRIIKILGVLSLLILFEYLTLLLHPYVTELTHHTPVYEMLIFVSIAAILIPAHHRVENWLIKWLTKNRPLFAGNRIKMKTTKMIKKTI
jgi:tetratricopeptide (TPR) repeat protein